MRFLPFLLMALAAITVPTSMAAPSHLHRMVTNAYTTKPPTTSTPTIYYAPTEEPTEPPTEAPTYPPTEAPTEAPTYPPTEAPTTYAPTYAPTTEAPTYAPTTEAPTTAAPYTTKAPTTSAPTTYYPPTDAPTEPPTRPAPTQLTWCHHEIIASTQEYTDVEFDLAEWMNTFLSFFGLDGTHTDYLTISLIPGAIDAPAIGNCTSPYVTTVDAYIRITLPSDIYPDFATRYDQYQLDHPWSVIPSTTCGAIVELNNTCTNAPSATAIVPTTTAPTTAPTTATTTAPTPKIITTAVPTTSTPTNKTTIAPTTKAPTARAPTQQPTTRTPTQKVNTTKVPTSAPTSSTITITTNVTQPDPNTRCIAGVCVSINNSATSTHIAIVPVMASILALIMAAF